MPTTLSILPNEVLESILLHARVNDQICLAMTSKSFYARIRPNKYIASNSPSPEVRYEAWRFAWLVSPSSTLSNVNKSEHLINLDDRARVKEHLRRCRRSSKRELRARLLGKRALEGPPPKVFYVTRAGAREASTRKAAVEAGRRISRLYDEGRV